jgi:hypothetical protein
MPARRLPHAVTPLAAAAALLLAACASDAPKPPCPEVAVPQDAARLVTFADGGRDLTDVRHELAIADVALGCEVDEGDDGRVAEAELAVLFSGERGPASAAEQVGFRYFVAVADSEDRILARESFELTMEMPGNQRRVLARDTVSPTIPLAEGRSPAAYRIYVGFVLSQEQLAYNRDNPS